MFTDTDKDRIIQMDWQDRTTFEAIKHAQKRNPGITLFKCSLQKAITITTISKH